MAWKTVDGTAFDFKLVSRLVDDETGARREVRKLAVDAGFVYHFVTFEHGHRTESCTFVPTGTDSRPPEPVVPKGKK